MNSSHDCSWFSAMTDDSRSKLISTGADVSFLAYINCMIESGYTNIFRWCIWINDVVLVWKYITLKSEVKCFSIRSFIVKKYFGVISAVKTPKQRILLHAEWSQYSSQQVQLDSFSYSAITNISLILLFCPSSCPLTSDPLSLVLPNPTLSQSV